MINHSWEYPPAISTISWNPVLVAHHIELLLPSSWCIVTSWQLLRYRSKSSFTRLISQGNHGFNDFLHWYYHDPLKLKSRAYFCRNHHTLQLLNMAIEIGDIFLWEKCDLSLPKGNPIPRSYEKHPLYKWSQLIMWKFPLHPPWCLV